MQNKNIYVVGTGQENIDSGSHYGQRAQILGQFWGDSGPQDFENFKTYT